MKKIRIETEYPVFRKIREEVGDERISLEEVRKVLSKIKGSLAEG